MHSECRLTCHATVPEASEEAGQAQLAQRCNLHSKQEHHRQSSQSYPIQVAWRLHRLHAWRLVSASVSFSSEPITIICQGHDTVYNIYIYIYHYYIFSSCRSSSRVLQCLFNISLAVFPQWDYKLINWCFHSSLYWHSLHRLWFSWCLNIALEGLWGGERVTCTALPRPKLGPARTVARQAQTDLQQVDRHLSHIETESFQHNKVSKVWNLGQMHTSPTG